MTGTDILDIDFQAATTAHDHYYRSYRWHLPQGTVGIDVDETDRAIYLCSSGTIVAPRLVSGTPGYCLTVPGVTNEPVSIMDIDACSGPRYQAVVALVCKLLGELGCEPFFGLDSVSSQQGMPVVRHICGTETPMSWSYTDGVGLHVTLGHPDKPAGDTRLVGAW